MERKKYFHKFKIIRKFANEFRRKGEMTMAPVQTTPNPSSLGFAALLCKELRRGMKIPEGREVATRCRSLQRDFKSLCLIKKKKGTKNYGKK